MRLPVRDAGFPNSGSGPQGEYTRAHIHTDDTSLTPPLLPLTLTPPFICSRNFVY